MALLANDPLQLQLRKPSSQQIKFFSREKFLSQMLIGLSLLLIVKMLFSIIAPYRFYFPADFSNSAFLAGHEFHFWGWYAVAFYAHIVVGPVVLLLSVMMLLTANRAKWRAVHRFSGRILGILVIAVLVPSGLVMATRAFSGPIAAWGFAFLSIATAAAMIATVYFAITHKFQLHRRWSQRCFILLCSPLVLRLFSGTMSVFDAETEWTYRFSVWASWLIPLLCYEIFKYKSWQTQLLTQWKNHQTLNRSLLWRTKEN